MNKTKVIKIKFTKAEQEEIDKINRHEPVKRTRIAVRKDGTSYEYTTNRPLTSDVSRKRFVELYGGKCTSCGIAWPAYKVLHNRSDKHQGAWLVQRYCQPCYDKWKHRITE
jgi:hypothetical protein